MIPTQSIDDRAMACNEAACLVVNPADPSARLDPHMRPVAMSSLTIEEVAE